MSLGGLQEGQTQSFYLLEVSGYGRAPFGGAELGVVVTPLTSGAGQLIAFKPFGDWFSEAVFDALPALVEMMESLVPSVPTSWLLCGPDGFQFLVREGPYLFGRALVQPLRPGIPCGSAAALQDYFGEDARITLDCLDRHAGREGPELNRT